MHTVSYEEPQNNPEKSQQNSDADEKLSTQSRALDLSPISPGDLNVSDSQINYQGTESFSATSQRFEQELESVSDYEVADASV